MKDEIFDPQMDPDAGDAADWQPVERAPKRRSPGVVLSVRVDAEIVARLETVARKRGVTVSEAARDALSSAVQEAESGPYGVRVQREFSQGYGTTSVTISQRGSLTSGGMTVKVPSILAA